MHFVLAAVLLSSWVQVRSEAFVVNSPIGVDQAATVLKELETFYQICTEKYPSPEKQGRCSVCTVSPRHVFLTLEITGVVWAICERFPSSFVCECM